MLRISALSFLAAHDKERLYASFAVIRFACRLWHAVSRALIYESFCRLCNRRISRGRQTSDISSRGS